MKKQELIKAVAVTTELTQKQVKEVLDATELVLKDVMKSEDEITVFGVKFATRLQKGRDGVSPMTGEPYHTEDKIVPKLKAMKSLKEACL